MDSSFWNSSEAIGKAVSAIQSVLVAAAITTGVLGAVQYKLSSRRDVLVGISQKQKELQLNERVSSAAQTAEKSVKDLQQANVKLSQTQEHLTWTAKNAALALEELALSKKKLNVLEIKTSKLNDLSVRLQISTRNKTADPNFQSIHFMDAAPVLILGDENAVKMVFAARESDVEQQASSRNYFAELQLVDRGLIAGESIESLLKYNFVHIDIGRFLKTVGALKNTAGITQIQIFIRINGTENLLISQSLNEAQVADEQQMLVINLGRSMRMLVDHYNHLASH